MFCFARILQRAQDQGESRENFFEELETEMVLISGTAAQINRVMVQTQK